jgi:hypothetical protein
MVMMGSGARFPACVDEASHSLDLETYVVVAIFFFFFFFFLLCTSNESKACSPITITSYDSLVSFNKSAHSGPPHSGACLWF